MKYRVYLAASTQDKNIGVGQYGTEQDNMQLLADRIGLWLKSQKKFTVFRNRPGWTLSQTVHDCNNLACDIFVDNHSNAGKVLSDGTEIYYTSANGRELANSLIHDIAVLSPGSDRGVIHDSTLYSSGLYVLRQTKPVAALIEHFYHSNTVEVIHFLANIDKYAKATAKGICKYFNVKWEEYGDYGVNTKALVDKMEELSITTSPDYWQSVLDGKQQVNVKYLQIIFARLLNKI